MSLRRLAESRLERGTAPPARAAVPGTKALSALFDLAGDPANANAALKMLHELQVHQVELDLQHEQLEQNRDELTHALERYVERYEFAPVAFLAVAREGMIIEGNLAAAGLLEMEQAALIGQRLDRLVTEQYRPAILALLKRLGGGTRASCEVQVNRGGKVSPPLQVVATVAPGDRSFLMAWMEMPSRAELDAST
jgi:hypothetical protein